VWSRRARHDAAPFATQLGTDEMTEQVLARLP
jgi:hypothetical protein